MDFCLSLYISCDLESRKYLHEINLQQASRLLGLIWESRFPSNLCKFSSLCTHLIMPSEFLLCFIVIVMYYIYLVIPFYILKVWSRNRHIWLCSSIEFKYSSESKMFIILFECFSWNLFYYLLLQFLFSICRWKI